jgi:AcrR family transcriptional regulator
MDSGGLENLTWIRNEIMIKEMKQQLVRGAIVAETRKQFLEKGIQKTTLRGIAKELQIAFGNIYYYFKSKIDICDILWIEYTNEFLDFFENQNISGNLKGETGLNKLRFYYSNLYEYFEKNPLYAELIAFSMGERPRHLRASGANRDQARTTRSRLQNTLIGIYNEGIEDGSIKAEISNVFFESWSFNISFVAIVINIMRYQEISIDVYDYYVKNYLDRLAKWGEKNEIEIKG